MKRWLGHGLAALCVVGGLSLASVGCADNNESIFVVGVLPPPTVAAGESSCPYVGSLLGPFLLAPRVDVALAETYAPVIVVGNQLTKRAAPTQNKAESSRVYVRSVAVRLTDTVERELGSFTSPTVGTIEASEGLAQITSVRATLISARLMANLANSFDPDADLGASRIVIANVKVTGQTSGGKDIESGEVAIPIEVCFGCLAGKGVNSCGFGNDQVTDICGPNNLYPKSYCGTEVAEPRESLRLAVCPNVCVATPAP